jgi:hypothetical protein
VDRKKDVPLIAKSAKKRKLIIEIFTIHLLI